MSKKLRLFERAVMSSDDHSLNFEVESFVGTPTQKMTGLRWNFDYGLLDDTGFRLPDDHEAVIEKIIEAIADTLFYKDKLHGEFRHPANNPYYVVKWRIYLTPLPE